MEITEKYLWVEKYRPRELEHMVLSDDNRKIFKGWIDKKEIPNTLFVGKPGSGKTTLARILVDHIITSKTSDLLLLNGSSQRGIDIVREQIEDFLRTIIIGQSKIKIVFIDEFDFMTQDAQSALRHIIEKYSDRGRFLLTANYESKISDAIRSRMQTFVFSELPKEFIVQYCENILKKEDIKYEVDGVKKIVNLHHPDVRKIIGILQSRSDDGELSYNLSEVESQENKCRSLLTDIINGIKNNDNKSINISIFKSEQLLNEIEVDYNALYTAILQDKNVPFWTKRVVVEYFDRHRDTASPPYNYIAMLQRVWEVGNKLSEVMAR